MQVSQLASRLVPYIADATMAAFALIYWQQSLGTGFNPSDRISFQSETAQPMNTVDRSHKGDRFFGGQQTYGQAVSDSVASGNMELVPMTAPVSDTAIAKRTAESSGWLRICIQFDGGSRAENCCRALPDMIRRQDSRPATDLWGQLWSLVWV